MGIGLCVIYSWWGVRLLIVLCACGADIYVSPRRAKALSYQMLGMRLYRDNMPAKNEKKPCPHG